jgi:hypothetical protein
MPIEATAFSYPNLCSGAYWAIKSEAHLAQYIARVALGQSHHVEAILADATGSPSKAGDAAKKAAVKMLTADSETPWHRDGWLFQVISWIAARKASPAALTRAPHMILAHKGFDGLSLECDSSKQKVVAAVIFEDKATDNPRNTITGDVWPAFRRMESGESDNVLVSEVVTLLRNQTVIDPDSALESILWQEAKHYRVSITVGTAHDGDEARQKLFKGYESAVLGDLKRRRGETLVVSDLRPWLAQLANLAIAAVWKI